MGASASSTSCASSLHLAAAAASSISSPQPEPELEPRLQLQPSSPVDKLPVDIITKIAQLLLGSDILRLLQCDRRLYKLLGSDRVWRHRLPSRATAHTTRRHNAKDLYASHARSLLFRGDCTAATDHQHAVVDSMPMPLALFPKHRDISFDLWVALVRPLAVRSPATTRTGGVLIGAQDIRASLLVNTSAGAGSRFFLQSRGCVAPRRFEIFAVVDENCDLHCSVLNYKPIVAKNLQFHRWYHLALTYDHTKQHQRVFLDGELVKEQDGITQWPWLQYAQLGKGFVADDSDGSGGRWVGFHGLIDEFCVCYVPWTAAQVRQLAQGKRTNAPMAYALSRDLCWCDCGDRSLEVSCTCPAERHVEIMNCRPPRAPSSTQSGATCCGQCHGCSAANARPKKKTTIWKLMRQCL